MDRLFNEIGHPNEKGCELSREIDSMMNPFIEKCISENVNITDLEALISSNIHIKMLKMKLKLRLAEV